MITVAVLTYKRPKFLKECLEAIKRSAGIKDYEILIHDNSKRNIGAGAMPHLLKRAKGEYFVSVGDDVLWFSPNWLKTLVEAFEQKPGIDTRTGFKDEWGCLGISGLEDDTTNSGMWPDNFTNKVEYKIGNIWYWGNVTPHTGALIFKTEKLRELNAFPKKPKRIHYIHSHALWAVQNARLMTGQLRDVYAYEACSPLWQTLCPEIWKAKQDELTIEEGLKIYEAKGKFNFKNTKPLEYFKKGRFNEYATKLYKQCLKS